MQRGREAASAFWDLSLQTPARPPTNLQSFHFRGPSPHHALGITRFRTWDKKGNLQAQDPPRMHLKRTKLQVRAEGTSQAGSTGSLLTSPRAPLSTSSEGRSQGSRWLWKACPSPSGTLPSCSVLLNWACMAEEALQSRASKWRPYAPKAKQHCNSWGLGLRMWDGFFFPL